MFFTNENFGKARKKPDVFKSIIRPPKQREFLSDDEIIKNAMQLSIYDVESYPDYFCVGFMLYKTGQVFYFEDSPDVRLNKEKLLWKVYESTARTVSCVQH